MSRRAWVLFVALGLIILAESAWYFASRDWNSYLTYQDQHSIDREADTKCDKNNPQNPSGDNHSVTLKCEFFSWLTKFAQEHSSYHYDNQAQQDLKAQQDMAEWSYGSMILAKWTLILSSLGVLGVVTALFQTTASLRHASEANKLMWEERRPWVTFSIERGYRATFDHNMISLELTVTIENLGKYPAIEVQTHYEFAENWMNKPAKQSFLEYCRKYTSETHKPFSGHAYFPDHPDKKTINLWFSINHKAVKNGVFIFALTYVDPSNRKEVFCTIEAIGMGRAVNDPKNELLFHFASPFRSMLFT